MVSAALRGEPERVVASEAATKSLAKRRVTPPASKAVRLRSLLARRRLHVTPLGRRVARVRLILLWWVGGAAQGGNKEPQAVLQQETQASNSQTEMPQPAGGQAPSETPSGPEPQPQQHQTQPQGNHCRARKKGAGPSPPKES